ncbi:MAG: GMC family oxidoreductase [bacterium]
MANIPSAVPGILGNTSLSEFDVVLIGSGAGGGAAARVLAKNGLTVCILEAGTNYFPGIDDPAPGNPKSLFANDELALSVRSMIQQQSRIEPRSFRASPEAGDRTYIGEVNDLPKTVGGGWVHADMKVPRFAEFDFRMHSELGDVAGADFADWPLTYDELESYYAAAERIGGAQGVDGVDPFQPWRSSPYPMPPGADMYVSQVLRKGADALGLHAIPYPALVTSEPYRDRPACNDCGFCSGFGCPINAKGSVAHLRDALLTGNVQLRTECRVVALHTDAGGRIVRRAEYIGPEGRRDEVRGDRFLLAASPIESARLLLLSDPGGAGLGNSSGLVGRNLMFHHQTNGVGIFPQNLHGERGKSVSSGFSDFRGVPNDPERPLGGIVEFGTESRKISDARQYLEQGWTGGELKSFLRSSPFGAHIAVLLMQGEDAPQASNRVDLDPDLVDIDGIPVPRITYQAHPFELHAREFYGPKMIDLVGAAGAQFGFVSPINEGGETPTSSHVMGTLRMGTDPKKSVVDAFCRFHDIENLYACDGAPFPTGSGYNPTLTLQALAMRTAGAIVDPLRPEAVVEKP